MGLKRNGAWLIRPVLVPVCILALAIYLAPRSTRTQAQDHVRSSVTRDWSSAHMVYSAPSSRAHAWRLQAEPRYVQQSMRRNAAALLGDRSRRLPAPPNTEPRVDWGHPLLAGGSSGVGQFPAKFTFDVTAAPSCTNDFVVFNQEGIAGVAPTAAAAQTGTFTGEPIAGQTVTITTPEATLMLSASARVNTGLFFEVGGGIDSDAANLAAAIARNGIGVGVTATSTGTSGVVTVTALADGAEGNLVRVTKVMRNFAWAAARLAGGAGSANVVAFNNLYSSQQPPTPAGLCGESGPSVYWSYYTGTGTASTSVVLSQDGTKIAFVEASGTVGATLRVLQWKAGEGTGAGYPVAPDITVTPGDVWSADCTAGNSCISSLTFAGGFNDTRSSPFYDYANDTLYVGDNSGRVHKFTGVFGDNSVLAEVSTVWPIQVHGIDIMTSPVYDSVSGNIYVADSGGRLSFIRDVGSVVGTCSPAPCLDATHLQVGTAGAIVDTPIVDGSTEMVYAVNGRDTTNNGTILQATTDLTTSVVSFSIGGAAAGTPADGNIYSGTFDNAYYNSSIPNIAGHMYVCGKDPANTNRPAIYQLSFNPATAVLTSVGTPLTALATADDIACSPVTEFDNPNGGGAGVEQDWIFFSFGGSASAVGPVVGACTTTNIGCLVSINVVGEPSWPPANVGNTATLPTHAAGSSSGIVVDNISTSAQASSIYFSLTANSTGIGPGLPSCNTTAAVGCAVKLTQSGLR